MENQVQWLLCLLLECELFTEKMPAVSRWQGRNESSVLLARRKKTVPAANELVVVWLWSYASWALIHRYLPLTSFSLPHHSAP